MFADFSAASIVTSLIFSSIGFIYFSYGKKQKLFGFMLCGLFLMLYTYFTDGMALEISLGIGAVIMPFVAKKFGWI